MIPALASPPYRDDEISVLQNFEVLHDGATVNVWKMSAQRPCRKRLVTEVIENLTTDRRSQCLEYPVGHCLN